MAKRQIASVAGDWMLWNAPLPPPRKPTPGEPLWSLLKDHETWTAELRYHGEYGVECQILRDGELAIGRRFDLKAQAIAWERRCGES